MVADSFPRSFVAAAAAAGIIARLLFGLAYWTGEPLNRDEVEYLSLARSLAAGNGYRYDEHVLNGPVEPFGRAPGYPVFLALTGGGQADSVTALPASVKIVQALAGGLGVLLIGWAAFRMAGRGPAMAAAAMAAVYPPLVWVAGYAYSEAIFWPIGIGLAVLATRMLEAPPAGARPRDLILRAAVCGLAAGAAILVRAATLLFLPIAALMLLWRRRFVTLAVFLSAAALIVGPWSLRTSLEQGRFVIIASDGGVTFWTGNNPLAIGEGDMAANPHLKLANRALRAAHPGLDEEAMEPIYYRESLTWIREHPLDWAWLMLKKAFYTVIPIGPSYRVHSSRYYAASVVALAIVLPLAVLGWWRLRGRRGRLAGMWLLAAAAVATCLVFFPQERFRIPVLDPSLILLASGAWLGGRPAKAAADADRAAA
jgi:hypothetical protein